MEQNQEAKQQGESGNQAIPAIYVGPFQGKWSVSKFPDIFGEPFYTKEQAIIEAQQRAKSEMEGAEIKVYNEDTKQFDVI